ncbi:MAG: hypothetical protein BA868_02265 [Desulfobacterales bacterium C00003106]|jgi:MFS family permease|nr:MAG: hypothetical protein BA868_02265 [Desulfobacterales bacterium C00003106]
MTAHTHTGIIGGITRNVFILGLVSLFTDLSSQMVFPLIPLFLTSVLGCGALVVGVVEGAAETCASFLKVVSGYWSDKIRKRKPFILFGYSMSSIIKPLFALANAWSFVLFLRVIERIGKGLRTAPRDALVAESCDESVRGRAYGFHRAADGIGSMLGALLALLLLPAIGYRNIFLFALIPGMISVFVIFFVREKKAQKRAAQKEVSVRLGLKQLPANLKLYIVACSIFALGHFGYPFFLLRAKNIGLADNTAILAYLLFYVVYSISAVPSGILSDRIGRRPVLIGGYLAFGITSAGLIFSSSLCSMLFLFMAYGISYAMIDGTQRAFVVDLAPQHLKGTALGVFHTATGMVALPGGYIAGSLWDKISPEATFVYGLSLTAASVVFFFFVKRA